MADETVLGVEVRARPTGFDATAASIERLRIQLKSISEALQSNIARDSATYARALQTQFTSVSDQLNRLTGAFVKNFQSIEGFNIRAIAAMRGHAEAIKGVARELTEADRIYRSGVGRVVYGANAPQGLAIASLPSGAAHALRQKELEQTFGAQPTMASQVAARNEAEMARIRAANVRTAGAAAIAWKTASADTINSMLGIGRAAAMTEDQAKIAFNRGGLRRIAEKGGEDASPGFWKGLFSGRFLTTMFDESMRGQRGQMAASIGSAIKRTGAEIPPIALGVAGVGIGAVIGVNIIERLARANAKLAEDTHAAAAASGMAVGQMALLQGAMILTGSKAESANASMRMFAVNVGKAMWDGTSRGALALHNMGIKQDEIVSKGQNTFAMFMRVAEAMSHYADSAVKAQMAEDLFGRSDSNMMKLLDKTSEEFKKLIAQSGPYAQAMRENAKANEEMGSKLEEMALKWDTVKVNASGALNTVVEWILKAENAVLNFKKNVTDLASAFNTFATSFEDMLYRKTWGILGIKAPPKEDPARSVATVLDDVDVRAKAPPYGKAKHVGGGDHREYTGILDEQRAKLRELQQEYKNYAEQQTSIFDHQRTMARMARADKELSPVQAAREELAAYRTANQAKIAELDQLKIKTDTAYNLIIEAAKRADAADAARGKASVRRYETESLNKQTADIELSTKQLKLADEVESYKLKVIEAHRAEVKSMVAEWGAAFDKIGSTIEDTIGTAIKSAFEPMKPEYWWSSRTGPHGQPLMVPHRINPTTQLLGNAGMSIASDTGKEVLKSVTASIGKSIGGEAAKSLGEGIAMKLGVGTAQGLLNTGIGAVSKAGIDTATDAVSKAAEAPLIFTPIVTAIGTSTAAIVTALQEIVAVDTALFAKPSVLGTTFSYGGIVPSARGGWMTPNVGGGMLSILHAKEMVLPSDVTEKVLSGSGGGSSMHLHFHGPSDAPSVSRWVQNAVAGDPNLAKNLIRKITPRMASNAFG